MQFSSVIKKTYILDDANAQYKSFCKHEKNQKRFWNIWLSRYLVWSMKQWLNDDANGDDDGDCVGNDDDEYDLDDGSLVWF